MIAINFNRIFISASSTKSYEYFTQNRCSKSKINPDEMKAHVIYWFYNFPLLFLNFFNDQFADDELMSHNAFPFFFVFVR